MEALEEALRACVRENAELRKDVRRLEGEREMLKKDVVVLNATVEALTAALPGGREDGDLEREGREEGRGGRDVGVQVKARRVVREKVEVGTQTDGRGKEKEEKRRRSFGVQVDLDAGLREEAEGWRWVVPILDEYGLWVPPVDPATLERTGDDVDGCSVEGVVMVLVLLVRRYELTFLDSGERDRLVSVPFARTWDDWKNITKLFMLPAPHYPVVPPLAVPPVVPPVPSSPPRSPPRSRTSGGGGRKGRREEDVDPLPPTPAQTPALDRVRRERRERRERMERGEDDEDLEEDRPLRKVTFSPYSEVREITPLPDTPPTRFRDRLGPDTSAGAGAGAGAGGGVRIDRVVRGGVFHPGAVGSTGGGGGALPRPRIPPDDVKHDDRVF